MSLNILITQDRSLLSSHDEKINLLINKYDLRKANSNKTFFCGLVISDGIINIFLPRNSDKRASNQEDKIKLATTTLQAINKYSEFKYSSIESKDKLISDESLIGTERLSLIMSLLNDYSNNGLYSKRVSKEISNGGKPNWKRTIALKTPFPSNSGPIYPEITGLVKNTVSTCQISKIHAEIISYLDSNYGWLITGNDQLIDPNLRNIPHLRGSKLEHIALLEKELRSAYSDRDIFLLKTLIYYLKNTIGSNQSEEVIGIKDFHHMWEHMIDKCLINNYPMNGKMISPAYRTNDGNINVLAQKGQRTDTILKHPIRNKFCIVDAKYYDVNTINAAPGWPDLVKQFFYAKALAVYNPNADIRNAFIFPGKDGYLTSAHVVDRKRQDIQEYNDIYPQIDCFYIEPISLLNNYINNIQMVELSNLLLQ